MTLLNKRMKLYSLLWGICMVILFIGYLFTPYSTYLLGLMIGLSASFLNLWTNFRNAKVITELKDKLRPSVYFSYVLVGFGFVMRVALAIIAVWLALRFPGQIDLASVVIGLASLYIAMIVGMLLQTVFRKR